MARQAPNLVEHVGHTTPSPLPGIETASSTWKKGAFLVFSSGKLAEASANPRNIAGMALSNATGTTDTKTVYADIQPGVTTLEMSLDKASDLGNRALAQSDVGVAYGVTLNTGIWYVDIDKVTAGTNTAVVVIALIDPIGAKTSDTPSDTNSGGARVRVKLLGEASLFQQAAS